MHVKNIRLSGFRNLVEQRVELSDGLNLLAGENGQGKTNFLEAVYLLATLRSFRSASVRDVIKFGESEADIFSEVESQGAPAALRVQLSGPVRRLWVGMRPVHTAREYLGQLKVVAFTPDDLAMIKGGPQLRRRFLDRAAFLFDQRHLTNVKQFNHALKARNRLLKERQLGDRAVLDSFSQKMAVEGSQVSRIRREIVKRVGEAARGLVTDMLPDCQDFNVDFKPGWEMGDEAKPEMLLEQIQSNFEQDVRRGQTCLGPQQDDFEVKIKEFSARRFASQGQQRTSAVALLLAVVREVVKSGGEQPVILLDDVSSELDAARRRQLFQSVDDLDAQTLITTTDYGMVADLEGRRVRRFDVIAGRIEARTEGGLAALDWCIVGGYIVFAIAVGFVFSRRAGRSISEYFLSGRNLPWWVVGSSMVATTFAADTPLAVTEYVRQDGIWRNWIWWALAISHVLAAVVFSRLWRRAMVLTDNELIEIRYHGKPAAALRAFKACYFSTLYNFIVMGWVTAAMSTVLSSFMKIPIVWAVVACMAIALFYSVLSGFWGVVVTDLLQFGVAIVGSIVFAILAASEAGGMSSVVADPACAGASTLAFFPTSGAGFDNWMNFLVFVLVMWWAYQGSDGGGYIIQRMMSAKDERHALLGTFWFAVAHYMIRVWPWVVVALVSMVMLPGFTSDKAAYPTLLSQILPVGLKGLCVAVFLAAYMSTIDTHLNWGSSYIINDLYKRFVRRQATEKHYVFVSRIVSVVLMLVSGYVALQINRITAAWELLWALGAGIGAVLILRWFWWRINAWSEISALGASLVIATALQVYDSLTGGEMQFYVKLLTVVIGSAVVWLTVTFLTRPEPEDVLKRFTDRVRPGGRWPHPVDKGIMTARTILAWVGGVSVVLGGMFLIGGLVLGNYQDVLISGLALVVGLVFVFIGLRGSFDRVESQKSL